MEILRPNPAPGALRHAVFDFDGTLSLLRAGWQRVMADQMVEALGATPRAEPEPALRAATVEPIYGLAGKPTLLQMQWLADAVQARGGVALSADAYKADYVLRLSTRLPHRAELESGRKPAAAFLVPGALAFVAALRARGVTCHIASGTDETDVRAEAALLGLTPYLTHLRGARPDGSDAKRELIAHLVAEHDLGAAELAAFGDGRAEMEYARAAGGLAIGLATTEDERDEVEPHKRALLLSAGADVILPNFTRPAALFAYLWPNSSAIS
ncbi:MAG: HAD family hydrolase [Anaerolineales bacterium]|nr:HAD family hydrolase [Anaerolineales bacterium]